MAKPRKISLDRLFGAMDLKRRDFLTSLDSEERKEFSAYLSMRYASCVEGSEDLQEYYLLATNKTVNQHYSAVSRHPELQWLLLSAVSPGMGRQRHYWLKGPDNRGSGRSKRFLEQLYRHLSDDEIDLMLKINDRSDLIEMARQLGWDDRRIKDEL